jgi:diacylglycerol O-acyltransferase-1
MTLLIFLSAQVITPTLRELVKDLEKTNGKLTLDLMAEYGLKLSIANTYCWLLVFYGYFHVYLNIFAEVLRFGDRVFYKDWWNSSDVSSYWRLWNTPVHYWLVRHLYFPCVRSGFSKTAATLLVFFVSAVMHEVLISLPFHMIRPWAYLGMMGQIPLVWITKYLTKKLPGTSMGNVIFWLSFCVVGQPMAILMYTIDYQLQKETLEVPISSFSRPHVAAALHQTCKSNVVLSIFGNSAQCVP